MRFSADESSRYNNAMGGMREIGARLGLSVATVSRGLRKDPLVRKETQELIEATARDMGYLWNPYVGELMSSIRRSGTPTFQGTVATLWAGGNSAESTDTQVALIVKGVMQGAKEHGLKVDEFWIDDHRPSALARILYHRGIEAVLMCGPATYPAKKLLEFPFADFAAVCVGWGLSDLQTHSVRFDYFHGMREALLRTAPTFDKRVAALWSGSTDRRANGMARAGFAVHHPGGMALADKLFFDRETLNPRRAATILKRHGVEALLVGSGISVPPEIAAIIPRKNWVEFRAPAPGHVFGWIDTQNLLMGLWGVEMLAAKLLQRRRGVPKFPQVVLVPPAWRSDRSA